MPRRVVVSGQSSRECGERIFDQTPARHHQALPWPGRARPEPRFRPAVAGRSASGLPAHAAATLLVARSTTANSPLSAFQRDEPHRDRQAHQAGSMVAGDAPIPSISQFARSACAAVPACRLRLRGSVPCPAPETAAAGQGWRCVRGPAQHLEGGQDVAQPDLVRRQLGLEEYRYRMYPPAGSAYPGACRRESRPHDQRIEALEIPRAFPCRWCHRRSARLPVARNS
jgi:hypothetical protein